MTVEKMKKINKKIPGILPPNPKTEVDGIITDLSSKTISELLELRDRQLKLLSKKYFVSKLADKGDKIQTFLNKINVALKNKQEEERTCRLFKDLKLNHAYHDTVHDMEWNEKTNKSNESYLDSDDDSEPEDVIHILSKNTTVEKKIKNLKPEKPFITAEDLIKIGDMPHIKYLVEKTELEPKTISTAQFKPFKTTKSDVHDPRKEVLRKKHKNWEITAATPPPIIHGPAKLLTLNESLNLQKQYNIHLKEVEAQHAADKLLSRAGIKMAELPADLSKFGMYREAESDVTGESEEDGSDKEVHDEEPERGGVVFTVMK